MFTVMTRKEELRNQIIEKARQQGGITYDEILAILPDAEADVSLLDEIMDELLDAGVDIAPSLIVERKETAFDATLRDFDADIDLTEEEEADLNAWIEDDLTDDAGYQQVLDSDDVVGLYLKEAGRVPLL